jgi:hypothetical protein
MRGGSTSPPHNSNDKSGKNLAATLLVNNSGVEKMQIEVFQVCDDCNETICLSCEATMSADNDNDSLGG